VSELLALLLSVKLKSFAAATHAALSLLLQLKLKGSLLLDVAVADSAKATAVMHAAKHASALPLILI
jgi:hypothetical protein